MADESHINILLTQGVEAWNLWREQDGLEVTPLFSGATLSQADLSGANLFKADLTRASLYKANLYKANLYEAGLTGADLYRANLNEADLSGANLTRAAPLCGTGPGLSWAPAFVLCPACSSQSR